MARGIDYAESVLYVPALTVRLKGTKESFKFMTFKAWLRIFAFLENKYRTQQRAKQKGTTFMYSILNDLFLGKKDFVLLRKSFSLTN